MRKLKPVRAKKAVVIEPLAAVKRRLRNKEMSSIGCARRRSQATKTIAPIAAAAKPPMVAGAGPPPAGGSDNGNPSAPPGGGERPRPPREGGGGPGSREG